MKATSRLLMRHIPAGALLCAVLLVAGACVVPPGEFQDLRRDITDIQLQVQQINSRLQDQDRRLEYSLKEIDQKLALQKDTIGATTRDLQDQMQRIERRMAGASSVAATGPTYPSSGGQAAPAQGVPRTDTDAQNELLLAGHEAYSRGDYDDAISRYSEFLQRYGRSTKAAEAVFCLSRSWYQKSDFEKAAQGFDRIAREYPGDEIVPKSMHSKALCEIRMGNLNEAMNTLATLMNEHPDYQADKIKALHDSVASGSILQP